MATTIPEALHRWYRSAYPILEFQPEWLQACVDYLVDSDPVAKASVPNLIKAVEVQLLSSDLSTSVIPPSSLPGFDSRPDARSKKQLLFASSGGPAGQTGPKKKSGMLVQVIEVDDVAHSALQLSDVLAEKREARKVAAKGGAAAGAVNAGRIMDLDEHADGDAAAEDLEAAAKRKAMPAGVGPVYPRGSGRFVVNDGGESRWTAFELQRIPGLGLEEIKLGTKLLLRDVPCVNGILMLTPQNTTVKGHQVEEVEVVKEWYIENGFRSRLGMDFLPDPRDQPDQDPQADPAPQPQPPREHNGRPGHANKKEEDDLFGDDIDFDGLLAEQAHGAAGPKAAAGGADDDDEEAMRELMMLEEQEAASGSSRPPPAGKNGRSKPVLARPKVEPASGSALKSSGSRIEVLALDSDEDDEDAPSQPARKKIKGEKPSVRRENAQSVINIDSD